MPSKLATKIAERILNEAVDEDLWNFHGFKAIIDQELAAVRKALEKVPCACKRLPVIACPQCGGRLESVDYPADSILNRDQFDSCRAGDWYCTNCKGTEAKSGYKYWWDKDLCRSTGQQCDRCDALASLKVQP